MTLNKKELAAVLVLAGSGILGWVLDRTCGDEIQSSAGLRVEADTSFCAPSPAAPPSAAQTTESTVCLNTASETELTGLPGIGPELSQRIIEYRNRHDGFRSVEEVMRVKGIGKKKFERIKGRLVVSAAMPSGS